MSRPRRIPGFDYVGVQRYSLTICTLNRMTVFKDPAVVDLVLDQFQRIASGEGIAILVYCVMPDHVHLLVEGQEDNADLKTFVKRAKQHSGFCFKENYGKRLWQAGYYEHVLREPENTSEVMAYVVNNPVRKGIVDQPADYPHWGSTVYTRTEILENIAGSKERQCRV
jgi:putative transposase